MNIMGFVLEHRQEILCLFDEFKRCPKPLLEGWRKLIPTWSWRALLDDTMKILQRQPTDLKILKIRILNAHVLVRREAFFPQEFLPEILEEALNLLESDMK